MGLLELIEEPSGKQISHTILLLLQPLQTGNKHFDIQIFLIVFAYVPCCLPLNVDSH